MRLLPRQRFSNTYMENASKSISPPQRPTAAILYYNPHGGPYTLKIVERNQQRGCFLVDFGLKWPLRPKMDPWSFEGRKFVSRLLNMHCITYTTRIAVIGS